MRRAICPIFVAIAILTPSARAKEDKWIEAHSPNFTVVTNGSASQARNTAIQFEQIRELFQNSLVFAKGRPTPRITVLAAKDENTLRDLLPEYWETKNHAHPAGIFLDNLYQFQVAVQLSGMSEWSYQPIYHEYYHSLTIPYFPELPVWLAEGLADFWGNASISDKMARVGIANDNLIELLRQQRFIPLSVLLTVDHTSPYYNENSKVSIFYAESWALTHYLLLGGNGAHRQLLAAYLDAIGHGSSSQEAAAKAFGDLAGLQIALQNYARSAEFYEMKTAAPEKILDSRIEIRPLSEAEEEAYRGGFLTLHRQYKQAEQLLQGAASTDPKLALAQQNLATFFYMQNRPADAIAALDSAINLDPQNALTRYLRAELVISRGGPVNSSQVESDLRASISADSNFAPPYALLASILNGNDHEVSEALEFAKKCVTLEPGISRYQMILAQVLARMRRFDEAVTVATRAKANSLDMNGKSNADQFISYVQDIRKAGARTDREEYTMPSDPEPGTRTETSIPDSKIKILEPELTEGRKRVDGSVAEVLCQDNIMEITVETDDGSVKLHSIDTSKVEFISDIPLKSETFWACKELKGHIVKVIFLPEVSGSKKPYAGEIETVEIKK